MPKLCCSGQSVKLHSAQRKKASVELALSFMRVENGPRFCLIVSSVTAIMAPVSTVMAPVSSVSSVTAIMAPVPMVAAIFVPVIAVIRLVPAGLYEIYGAITGVVLAAMLGPVPRVTRRNMQVHRFDHNVTGLTDNHHRLGIENLWRWRIAELYLSVDTRADLAADAQVDDGRSGMG